MFWADALAAQDKDAALKARFTEVAAQLKASEDQIVTELNEAQGKEMDIKGYYSPSPELAAEAMRPSATLNAIVDSI
jgi:isocitrate dehydrogenase